MSPTLRSTVALIAVCAMPTLAQSVSAAEADDGLPAAIVVTGERISGPEIDATKTGTPLLDTPQSVTTVSREQLDDQATAQLGDALRYVPGVSLGTGEGNRDQIVLRGQATTADFYLDGLRDDAQYYRPLYNTQRIEVLKGANALLFGRGGGGGVVNRVSKTAELGATQGSAAASGDSFGAWSVSGDLGLPLGQNAALRLNATYEEFANHRDPFGGHFIGVAPTATFKLGEVTKLAAAYEYAQDDRVADRGVPAAPGGTLAAPAAPITGYDHTFFGDPAFNRSKVDAHIARLRLDHEFSDSLTFNVTGQFAHYDKFYRNIVPGAVNASATTVSLTGYRNSNVRTNWVGQANLVWNGQTGPLRHTLLAGVEGSVQASTAARDDVRFGGASSTAVPLALRITVPAVTWVTRSASQSDVRSLSGYVQDQIEIGEHFQLIAGVRYDDFRIEATDRLTNVVTTRSDGKWSPRLGLVIKPVPNLSFYASYAKSFLPQSGDQFNTLAANLQTLAPESFRNIEAGVKWDLTPALSFTAAAFQLDRTNTRATDPITLNPVLTGSSRVKGAEIALSGRITRNWQASLGYAFQDGTIRTTTTAAPAGRRLDKLPRGQFSAWTRYDVNDKFGIGLGVVHQSSQFASISNAVRLPGFTRIDAAAYFNVTPNFTVQFNVENLTDTKYYPAANGDNNIAPGEPVNARITARVKF